MPSVFGPQWLEIVQLACVMWMSFMGRRSKTSRLIQSLVKAGLLARVNDSSDARRFALHCTAEGRALRNRARALADGLESILFHTFTADQRSAFEAQLGGLLDWVQSSAYHNALIDWEKSCDRA